MAVEVLATACDVIGDAGEAGADTGPPIPERLGVAADPDVLAHDRTGELLAQLVQPSAALLEQPCDITQRVGIGAVEPGHVVPPP